MATLVAASLLGTAVNLAGAPPAQGATSAPETDATTAGVSVPSPAAPASVWIICQGDKIIDAYAVDDGVDACIIVDIR